MARLRLFNKPLISASAVDEDPSEKDCELDVIRSTNNVEANDSRRKRGG